MKALAILCTALCSATLTAQAQVCVALSGSVKLTPDAACTISQRVPGVPFLGAPGTCFSIAVKGTLPGSGYAGMTLENVIGPVTGSLAQSPVIMNEAGLAATTDEFNLPETRRVFNSRSAFSLPGGTLYTVDVGIVGGGAASEQLIISGGDGFYKNASGILYTYNSVIGQWGPYTGKLCLPY